MSTSPPPNTPPDTGPDDHVTRLELLLGTVLRTGVVLSIIVMLLGLTISLSRHPDYLWDKTAIGRLMQPGAAFPHTLGEIGTELLAGRGRALTAAGLLLLIATPVARVAAAVISFAWSRDLHSSRSS